MRSTQAYLAFAVLCVVASAPGLAQAAPAAAPGATPAPSVSPAPIDPALMKAEAEQLAQKYAAIELQELKKLESQMHSTTSPKFRKAGLGIGASIGSNSTTGNTATTAAGFHIRSFQEGKNSHSIPSGPRSEWSGPLQSIPLTDTASIKEYISLAIHRQLTKKMVSLGYPEDITLIRAVDAAIAEYGKPALDSAMRPHEELATRLRRVQDEEAARYPMHYFEGNAQYNMIGTQANGGAFTGVTGDLRGGIGFSLKDHGKNGCDIYFLAGGNAAGQVHYNASSLDTTRAAVGIEQGLLCQVNNAVTFMVSPSVQAGLLRHSLPGGAILSVDDGKVAHTDWLNYAARGRLVWNDKMYVSGEYVHHPDMKGGSVTWKATEISGNVDYKVGDKWVVGARIKRLTMQDPSGEHADIKDTQVGVNAFRAF